GARGQGHRSGCCDLVELLVGGLQVAVAAAQRPTREELGARVGDQVGEVLGSLVIQVVQLVLDGGGGVGLVAAGQAGDDVRQQGRRRPRPIACAVPTNGAPGGTALGGEGDPGRGQGGGQCSDPGRGQDGSTADAAHAYSLVAALPTPRSHGWIRYRVRDVPAPPPGSSCQTCATAHAGRDDPRGSGGGAAPAQEQQHGTGHEQPAGDQQQRRRDHGTGAAELGCPGGGVGLV